MTFYQQNLMIFFTIMTICGISSVVLGHPESIAESGLSGENSTIHAPFFPRNSNASIQYLLYTPEHSKEVCYFEPEEANQCIFNTSYKFKILLHGYIPKLLPGNYFEKMKDTLLEYNKYNVIIVNWTKYYSVIYPAAVVQGYLVGVTIGKMINFLMTKGVNPSDFHIIGHSLGAHIAGVAGKQVPNLGRVTGLDPAGPFFSESKRTLRLTDTSAKLVDVIHTSNYKTGAGLGMGDAIGSINFYPNGGKHQPDCEMGKQFHNANAEVKTVTSRQKMGSCYHNIVLHYFINSIHLCNYSSVKCDNYEMYSEGRCNSNPTNRMGLFCEKNPGLPNKSRFYLNTSADSPYCEI